MVSGMSKKMVVAMWLAGLALTASAADVATPSSSAQLAAPAVAGTAAGAVPAAALIGKGVTPAAEKIVRQAVAALSSEAEINAIDLSPMPNFYQVIASGQMLYVSADGKFLLNGDMLDLAARRNVSTAAWARFRKAELARVPASERIVYAPAHPRITISVFTDVNCGFCRALHEHLADFNKAGIAVEYLAWPREGVVTTAGRPTATYTEMVSVWCAADPKAAFNAATAGHQPKAATCVNPVKDQFELGLKLGLTGTPTIYGPDGRTLGNYVTVDQLLKALKDGTDSSGG